MFSAVAFSLLYWQIFRTQNCLIFLQEGIKFTDPGYLAALDKNTLEHLLRSDSNTKIPMLDERLQVLKEAGEVLVKVSDIFFVIVVVCSSTLIPADFDSSYLDFSLKF